jgi:hypothetical protein
MGYRTADRSEFFYRESEAFDSTLLRTYGAAFGSVSALEQEFQPYVATDFAVSAAGDSAR